MQRTLSGIYEVVNVLNGKRYVGSSKNIPFRLTQHRVMLRKGQHHSTALQNAWDKHGPDAFQFNILALLELDDLVSTEQRLLDQEFAQPDTYNIARNAVSAMLGRKHKPETIAHMRESRKGEGNSFFGKKHTPENVEQNRLRGIGKARNKGNKHSDETKKKMSDAKKGRIPAWNLRVITHCKRGHEFTAENTYVNNGRRTCRICKNAAQQMYTKRKGN